MGCLSGRFRRFSRLAMLWCHRRPQPPLHCFCEGLCWECLLPSSWTLPLWYFDGVSLGSFHGGVFFFSFCRDGQLGVRGFSLSLLTRRLKRPSSSKWTQPRWTSIKPKTQSVQKQVGSPLILSYRKMFFVNIHIHRSFADLSWNALHRLVLLEQTSSITLMFSFRVFSLTWRSSGSTMVVHGHKRSERSRIRQSLDFTPRKSVKHPAPTLFTRLAVCHAGFFSYSSRSTIWFLGNVRFDRDNSFRRPKTVFLPLKKSKTLGRNCVNDAKASNASSKSRDVGLSKSSFKNEHKSICF